MTKADMIHNRLKEIADKFKELKNSGIDEELLIIYIMHKTKHSRKDVRMMLEATEEFYEKLIGNLVMEAL